jgi:REP element-mobilizing transposase RayT
MLRNHFHVLLRVRPLDALMDLCARKPPFNATVAAACDMPSRAFCAFFTAYSQGINKAVPRTGRLFAPHFGRLVVDNEHYFSTVLRYIHRNPVHHGFVSDLREWPWSSFHAMTSAKPTWLARAAVVDRFGSMQAMVASHGEDLDPDAIATCIGEDP